MKLFLAQLNTLVGDPDGNVAKAIAAWKLAKSSDADLVIFPEQTVPGYPAKDLLLQPEFLRNNVAAAEHYARATADGPPSLLGFAEPHSGIGKRLWNSAAFCRAGLIERTYRKGLLPTYDVFDESRYFDECHDVCVVEVAGKRVGVTICEDIWNDELYWSQRLYERDPVAESVAAGADVIVNLSASPFTMGKQSTRRALLSAAARRHGVPLVQVNLVGGNDDLIFDGSSLAFDAMGHMVAELKGFAEVNAVVDLDWSEPLSDLKRNPMSDLRAALVLGVKDYATKCGFKKVLIGLSGGIDSALVAALAAEALGPANVHGVSMPSRYSSDHSKSDAALLAQTLGIQYSTIPIEPIFTAAQRELEPHLAGCDTGLAFENLQSRIRGLTLMTLSNASGALVLTTGNKSELAVGYCTLYGDMCGGLAVIADLPKCVVYELSRFINDTGGRSIIPEGTLTKPPSAELRPDQKDTDSLPPYEELDPLLVDHLEHNMGEEDLIAAGHRPEVVRRIVRLVARSEYKRRQAAPTLKVFSRAFGFGWRMPLARG